jgi:hypothetical protein
MPSIQKAGFQSRLGLNFPQGQIAKGSDKELAHCHMGLLAVLSDGLVTFEKILDI